MLARGNDDGVERVAWEEGGKAGRMRERQCPEKKDGGGVKSREEPGFLPLMEERDVDERD